MFAFLRRWFGNRRKLEISSPDRSVHRHVYREHGFTLIELMVSVAIVGILAGLAMVAYSNYSTRAMVSEGIQLANGAESAAITAYQDTGTWPLTNIQAGYSGQVGKYVTSLQFDGAGNVVVTYGGQAPSTIAGDVLYMTPWLGSDGVTVAWSCGNAAPPTIGGAAATALGTGGPVSTVPVQYLPHQCHS